MKIEKIVLKNFRNIESSTFSPDKDVNFLVGSNGQGKTALLEAIGFLSTLRSFRDSKAANLIRWGTQHSDICCTLTSDHPEDNAPALQEYNQESRSDTWKTDLRVTFHWLPKTPYKASKIVSINEKPFSSTSAYLTQIFRTYGSGFHSVVFNPSDHDLVRGEPVGRRAYLSQAIAAEDIEYLQSSQKYQRALEQRNALLRAGLPISKDIFFGFTEQLCRYGIDLTLKRLRWIQKLNFRLNSILKRIAPSQPELKVAYLSNWVPLIENLSYNNNNLNSIHFTGQGELPLLQLLEQSFWARIAALGEAEQRVKHSLVGPHRDDWAFFLGDQILKGHGSQGEVRSALLALKLAEIELFRKETGHRPLFLLDDFSSELDRERRLFLLQFLMDTDLQTFVTTTEDTSYLGKRFWVKSGVIEEGNHGDRTGTVRFG